MTGHVGYGMSYTAGNTGRTRLPAHTNAEATNRPSAACARLLVLRLLFEWWQFGPMIQFFPTLIRSRGNWILRSSQLCPRHNRHTTPHLWHTLIPTRRTNELSNSRLRAKSPDSSVTPVSPLLINSSLHDARSDSRFISTRQFIMFSLYSSFIKNFW